MDRWTPPTTDHGGLKSFMREQIESSLKYMGSKPPSLAPLDPAMEYSEAIERAIRDVEYHDQKYKEEVERVAGRNKWVRDLYDSLGVDIPGEPAHV